MTTSYIPYQNTQALPKLLQEVMSQNHAFDAFYTAQATLENFNTQIVAKAKTFSAKNRTVLADCLLSQYKHLDPDNTTTIQIESLRKPNTLTITTGHQLNLMGGPLFFLYKIISAINLSKTLSDKYKDYTFIPIFWMATEDHDFEEINHFYFGNHCLKWQSQSTGAVGRLDSSNLNQLFEEFSELLGTDKNTEFLKSTFQKAYLKQNNLAEATRFLIHQFFGKDGLLVIDGDDKKLKQLFVPIMEQELKQKIVFQEVNATNEKLKSLDSKIKIQVNPRPQNLFYIQKDLRERIEEKNGIFRVLNTDLKWNLEGILDELHKNPYHFSPNVLMRPLYQETVLPNLCYIGGSGELSYWLQLKSCFNSFKLNYPLLLLRNSAIVLTQKQQKDLKNLGLRISDLFLSSEDLTTKVTISQTKLNLDFSKQKQHLKKQFESLYDLAKKTDPTFMGAVKAQEKKQIKGLSNLEKRLLKAEKRKHHLQISKVLGLKATLYPYDKPQERVINFSYFYALYGERFIEKLKSELDPLKKGFAVISL